jgi:hypothetical protein
MIPEEDPLLEFVDEPTYQRPWILLGPLGFTVFIFFLLTLMFLVGSITNKDKNETVGLLAATGIMALLFGISLFVWLRLYRGPKSGSTPTLPIWFTRGFGLVMASAMIGTYRHGNMSLSHFVQCFIAFLGIALTGDVVYLFHHYYEGAELQEEGEVDLNSDLEKTN